MDVFLPFHWPCAHNVTCKYLPTNNGLLERNIVQLCLGTNYILLLRKWNHAFLLSCDRSGLKMADSFVSYGV